MITSKAVFEEYDEIMKSNVSSDEKMLLIYKIVLKLLVAIRTNQQGGVKAFVKKEE